MIHRIPISTSQVIGNEHPNLKKMLVRAGSRGVRGSPIEDRLGNGETYFRYARIYQVRLIHRLINSFSHSPQIYHLYANMAGGTRGPVPVPLETRDQNVTQDVLDLLDTKQPLQTAEDFPSIPQAEIKAALDRLASRSMVEYQAIDSEQVLLTKEAEAIVADGSHEYKVWKAVKDAGKVPIKELAVGTQMEIIATKLGLTIRS